MKTNHPTKPLGEICKIEIGKTPARGNEIFWDIERKTSNVWLSIADLKNTKNKEIFNSKEYISENGAKLCKIVKKGTLLASFKLTLGRLAFAGKNLYTNEAIAALNINNEKEILKEYLYYYLAFFDWDKAAEGDIKVKGKTLNKAKLKQIQIPLPPLQIQRKIAAKLEKQLNKIDKLKQNTEKKLQNTKELFESYLEEIFKNPEKDWEKRKLSDCFRLKSGNMLTRKSMNKDGDFLVFGGNGIAGKHDKFNISGNNIIIGRVGALCGNARNIKEKIWLTDNAFQVVDFKFEFDNSFLTYLLNLKNLRSFARQTAQPVISNSSLKNLILQFPKSLKTQKQIASRLDKISEKIKTTEKNYQKELENIKELRKSVLKQAF